MKKILATFALLLLSLSAWAQPSSTPFPWAYRWTQLNEDTGGQYYRYIPLPAVNTTCLNFLSGMSTDTSQTDLQRQRMPGCYDIGDGLTITGNVIDTQVKTSTLAGYATTSALSAYLTVANATATYYPLSNPSSYITQAGARAAITLTTTGSGAASYNSTTGALNIPTPVTGGSGTVTSVAAGAGLSGGTITTSGTISMPNVGTAGTYNQVTTDTQGRVTAGTNVKFDFSQPTTRTLAVSTSYQALDNTKAAVIVPSYACQNATQVLASSACTIQVRMGTGTLTCSTGTVYYTQRLAVSLGVLITQDSTNPVQINLPIGASFIMCPVAGTFTIAAVEQSAG